MAWQNDYGSLSGSGASQNPSFGSAKQLGRYFDESNFGNLATATASGTANRFNTVAGLTDFSDVLKDAAATGRQALASGADLRNTGIQGVTATGNNKISQAGSLAMQSATDQAGLERQAMIESGATERLKMQNAQADKARKAGQTSTLGKIGGILSTGASIASSFVPGLGGVMGAAKGLTGAIK